MNAIQQSEIETVQISNHTRLLVAANDNEAQSAQVNFTQFIRGEGLAWFHWDDLYGMVERYCLNNGEATPDGKILQFIDEDGLYLWAIVIPEKRQRNKIIWGVETYRDRAFARERLAKGVALFSSKGASAR